MSVPGKEHKEPQVLKDVRAKAKAAGLVEPVSAR